MGLPQIGIDIPKDRLGSTNIKAFCSANETISKGKRRLDHTWGGCHPDGTLCYHSWHVPSHLHAFRHPLWARTDSAAQLQPPELTPKAAGDRRRAPCAGCPGEVFGGPGVPEGGG